jgi:transcriptional regulator with XRE-family HTH domain
MFLSNNIKYLRKSRGLTQNDLGEKVGVNGSQVTKYEKGTSDPPVDKLVQIADIFDMNLQDLVLTDLSTEAPRFPRPEKPYTSMDEDKQDAIFIQLNNELQKRIKILEDYIAENNPDQARRWGIIE